MSGVIVASGGPNIGGRMADFIDRRIVGFHQDDERHWVADLECGHTQHVRHQPPWQLRPWVITEVGRAAHLGSPLRCVECARPPS